MNPLQEPPVMEDWYAMVKDFCGVKRQSALLKLEADSGSRAVIGMNIRKKQ